MAGLKQPLRQLCSCQTDLPQAPAGDQPPAPLAQQQRKGPGGVGGSRAAEIGLERVELGARAAGAIQLLEEGGERLHQLVGVSSSSKRSASKWPSSGSALIPSTSCR